jgi:Ethylbenzene dehydrogenase
MKSLHSKYVWVLLTLFLAFGYVISCTKDDQVIDTPQVINSSTDLVSVKTGSAPNIDGVVDGLWANSQVLQFSTAVPDVTGDVFRGYTGNVIPWVKMRSAYDDNNIYFLVQWLDPTQSLKRSPWYFNPTTKRWIQELGTFDFSTSPYRAPFYEDKAAFLWNINNSVNGWNSGTCYKSCHTGIPAADGSSRHYTNFASEKIDMWHWKSVRGGVNAGNQIHDQYQDNSYPNGRKADPGVDVYQNNSQNLPQPGIGTVSVPKYVIPGRTDYGWIMNAEVSAGTAKLVTAIDANGVLTLSDATTIDPNVGTDYQRIGSGVGPKAIPGVTLNDSYAGSMGDIPCKAVYTTDPSGNYWTLEFKRALKTTDAVYDIDFSSLSDQFFGFAVFENAQIAHSIKANLVLKFKK